MPFRGGRRTSATSKTGRIAVFQVEALEQVFCALPVRLQVQVDDRGGYVAVSQLVVDGQQICAGLQQVGGITVPKRVGGDLFLIPEAAFACSKTA